MSIMRLYTFFWPGNDNEGKKYQVKVLSGKISEDKHSVKKDEQSTRYIRVTCKDFYQSYL